MTVLINAIAIDKTLQSHFYKLLQLIFNQIIIQNKNTKFIFIETLGNSLELQYQNNKKVILEKSNVISNIRFIRNYKIHKLIKDNNCDKIININWNFIKNNKDQIIILENLIKYSNSKKEFQEFQKKGDNKKISICCFFDSIKKQLIEGYCVNETLINKISIAPIYQKNEIDYLIKQQIKDGYADGREYFLFDAYFLNAYDTLYFLKAFSIFKKWQNSNMKLLIFFPNSNQKSELQNKLETYRYKDDVVIIDNFDEEKKQQIIAASYCYINSLNDIKYPAILLQAIQHNIPIICSTNNSIKEILGDSALYINNDKDEIHEIANNMKLIYKDENLKTNLSKIAEQKITHLNIDSIVEQITELIFKKPLK